MSQFNFDTVKSSEQPMNNLHAMIDIETFGTTAGSPIVTIGATLFDPFSCDSSEELLRRSFLTRIDIQSSVDLALKIDGGTMRWWFEQQDAAIKALVQGETVTAKVAMKQLWDYCRERGSFMNNHFFEGLSNMPEAVNYWAKDPDFDMVLLRYYYEKLDLKMPWAFWECRSVRTVQDLAWPNGAHERPSFEVPGVAHDARWDAIQQAMMVQAAIHRLGQSRDQDVEFKSWEGNDADDK